MMAAWMLWEACVRSDYLKIVRNKGKGWNPIYYKRAAEIALPIAFEHIVLCGAQVAQTHITAPLGTLAIAANTLAITAESLCYMPGYGVGTAATTLVGQSRFMQHLLLQRGLCVVRGIHVFPVCLTWLVCGACFF